MNLPIDDPRGRRLAEKPLAECLYAIADELAALAGTGGQDMTKDEIDAMWGAGESARGQEK